MRKKTNFFIYPLLVMGMLLVFTSSCTKDDDNGGDNSGVLDISFGEFTDSRDNKVYQTVTIGSQEWLAENLAYAPTSGNFWEYGGNIENVSTYGFLYDLETALTVCPAGWHLPVDAEWTVLTDYLGNNAGGKLKATGTIEAGTGLWHQPNQGATNTAGFAALPAGVRYPTPWFTTIGEVGMWWSATLVPGDPTYAYSRRMTDDKGDVTRPFSGVEMGYSVRCVKDK